MSSDDGPPGSPEASFTDIGGGTGVSGGETDDDRVDLELKRIRDRRINPENSFMVNTIIPQTFDDYTLVFGLVAGAVFFGSVLLTSSGLLFEDSITLDDTVSGTFLDPSDCIDMTGEIWFRLGSTKTRTSTFTAKTPQLRHHPSCY